MIRRSPLLLAALVLGGFGALALSQAGEVPSSPQQPANQNQAASSAPQAATDSALTAQLIPPAPTDAPAVSSADSSLSRRFATLPDGNPVPPLSDSAPQRVKLGIAIFRYAGAEAPPKSERKKEEALRLAQEAARRGQTDFAGAVAAGDRGSDENIGWIDRGVLEPAVEHAVFSLDVEKVAPEPIDSPR